MLFLSLMETVLSWFSKVKASSFFKEEARVFEWIFLNKASLFQCFKGTVFLNCF